MTDTLKIEQYDFVSFCQDMYNAFKQGYEPVWTSDDSPQQIGFCFHAVLHKVELEPVVVGKVVFEASLDTAKLQEQLKEGGEIEQMLADSLVVNEVKDFTDAHVAVYENAKQKEVPKPEPEPTMDEALPKEEQALLQTKTTPTKRGRK